MQSDGMICGCDAMWSCGWLVVRSCYDAKWLCDVANWKVVCRTLPIVHVTVLRLRTQKHYSPLLHSTNY